jgi:hypothetical protein
MFVLYALIAVSVITGCIIAFQDFKERLISLWLIIVYSCNCILLTQQHEGWQGLLSNVLTTVLYFGFYFLAVILFYYLKERKLNAIIDEKIGKADVILLLAIGVTMNIVELIVFSTIAFSFAAVLSLLLFKKVKTIPLGGILVLLHSVFMCIVFFE